MMNGDSNHNIEGVGVGELPSATQELEDQQTQQQQLGVTATNDQQQHEQQIKIESQEQQQHQDLPPADVDAAENSYQNQQHEDGTDASQSQQQQSTYTPLPTVVTQRPDSGCFLRCRGLPYSASENDVRKFFGEYTILDVSFTSSMDGKPTGECYVQFESREEASKAQLKDRQTMGTRYIEVFQVSDVEMGQLIKRMQMKKTLSTKGFVRIRGLPYSCGKADVQQFFRGLTVEEVIFGNTGPGLEGRPSGEGFVKFGTADEADSALQLNGQHMGSRYLEIFKSDGAAFEAFKTRSMNNIVPLKALAQSGDPWGSTGGYPPNAGGGGGYGGGGYSGGGQGGGGGGYGYGYGGPGYGAYQNQAYEFGSGYEQHASSGRPMGRGRGGSYGHGGRGEDQHSNRYSPYPNYGYGGGEGRGAGGRGRGGGGRGRGGGGYGGGGGGHDNGGEYGDYGYGYGGGGYVGYNDSVVAPNKIYMRGLPFRISTNDIERFFAPLMCVDISLGTMPDGRSSGDGIVEFQNPTDARQALAKDRESIGNRYIELFPTQSAKIPSHVSYDSVGGKGGGGGGGGSGGGHRGAPIPTPAQQYAQAVQQQVAAYASGNYPTQHQYGQYGQSDYSNSYYGSYGSGSGGQDVGQQQPKTDYNWPASQF